MNIRTKLTLLNVIVFSLVLVGLGLILRDRIHTSFLRNIDREMMQRTRPLGRGMMTPAGIKNPEDPNQQENRNPPPFVNNQTDGGPAMNNGPRDHPPLPANFPLYTNNAEPFMFRTPEPVDKQEILLAGSTRTSQFTTIGQRRVMTIPVQLDGYDLVFQTSQSLKDMYQDLNAITRELLMLSPFALSVTMMTGWFLAQRVLRPVHEITRKADTIRASNLAERLHVSGRDEFGQLSQTINDMLGRLESQFDQQKRFVSDASHELRSPLTVIKGAAELGILDNGATDRSRDFFRRIDLAADRTARLIDSLLFLARSDHAVLAVNRSEVDVKTLLASVIDEAMQSFPRAARPTVTTQCATINVDEALMHRLLCNLVINALRYTPENGSITVGVDPTSFVVTDNGIGIPPADLSRVHERFYRVDAGRARNAGGTGLGLSIVHSIAAAHGGDLHITSTVGEGTTITVTFSVKQATSSNAWST